MTRSGDFYPPMESEWHRMISEAAYFLAEKRHFQPGRSLSDWLEAERQVRQALTLEQETVIEKATIAQAPSPPANALPVSENSTRRRAIVPSQTASRPRG
jgi:hypothetical protein